MMRAREDDTERGKDREQRKILRESDHVKNTKGWPERKCKAAE
jgi:hypothetical protein